MDSREARRVYFHRRKEDAEALRKALSALPGGERFIEHLLWSNAALDENGALTALYEPLPSRGKFNAAGFEVSDAMPEIERAGAFCRLQVSVHRILDLGKFRTPEDFFRALSQKNRKKLRWLRNAVPELGCRIVPLEKEADFRMFEKVYSTQFPKHPAGSTDNEAVRRMYEALIADGRSYSFLLLSPEGGPLAAALGYFNGAGGYFYTHLTRSMGEYDKFSPGYYLTFSIVMKLLAEHPEVKYFFMGPGDYDYKRAFLGEAFPIYRYERRSLNNLPGLFRLFFRRHKERKRFLREHKESR